MKITKNYSEINFSKQFDNVNIKDVVKIKTQEELEKEELLEHWLKWKKPQSCYCGGGTITELFNFLHSFRTKRFLWHVSKRKHRQSIATRGLKQRENGGGIWANNNDRIDRFYPWAIDCIGYLEDYHNYDFWRIDTRIAKAEWRMDPYMHTWASAENNWKARKTFVCTLDEVPVHSLKLFRYEPTFYSDEPMKYPELYKESVSTNRLKPV